MTRQLFKFASVGAVGFTVDMACFYCFMYLGINAMLARLLAFWCAMFITWLGNYHYTFSQAKQSAVLSCFVRHVCVSHVLGAANILTFYYLKMWVPLMAAFVFGTLVAILGNFILSKYWVFTNKKAAT